MNDQTYVYDGGLQGWDDTFTEDIGTYVTVTGLKGSDGTGYDTLRSITVIGQKKNAGEYENASEPSAAVIGRNRATDDNLAANYAITYVKGKLTITKAQVTITAKDQTYTYNGELQGPAGTYTEDLDQYVTVSGLQGTDELTDITFRTADEGQKKDANEYDEQIVLLSAEVGEATDNYEFIFESGKLTITKAPLRIKAKDRTYRYNGSPQGPEGTYTSDFGTHVTITGLQGSDELTGIALTGQEIEIGEYVDKIVASDAEVGEATDNYKIEYEPGKLIIKKKLDPSPGTGDSTRTLLWMSIMLMSAVGFGGVMWLSSRRKRRVSK